MIISLLVLEIIGVQNSKKGLSVVEGNAVFLLGRSSVALNLILCLFSDQLKFFGINAVLRDVSIPRNSFLQTHSHLGIHISKTLLRRNQRGVAGTRCWRWLWMLKCKCSLSLSLSHTLDLGIIS